MICTAICSPVQAVHPHGRGDNRETPSLHAINVGSPPRAWGQFPLTPRTISVPRFTPTGVGTMHFKKSPNDAPSVHPHGRGDNWRDRNKGSKRRGSPPRAWGQSRRTGGRGGGVRFTPTGVGTIRDGRANAGAVAVHPHGRGDNVVEFLDHCVPAVHPHGRGDNQFRPIARYVALGSPPRAWGQCEPGFGRAGKLRFTPTGVGTISSEVQF